MDKRLKYRNKEDIAIILPLFRGLWHFWPTTRSSWQGFAYRLAPEKSCRPKCVRKRQRWRSKSWYVSFLVILGKFCRAAAGIRIKKNNVLFAENSALQAVFVRSNRRRKCCYLKIAFVWMRSRYSKFLLLIRQTFLGKFTAWTILCLRALVLLNHQLCSNIALSLSREDSSNVIVEAPFSTTNLFSTIQYSLLKSWSFSLRNNYDWRKSAIDLGLGLLFGWWRGPFLWLYFQVRMLNRRLAPQWSWIRLGMRKSKHSEILESSLPYRYIRKRRGRAETSTPNAVIFQSQRSFCNNYGDISIQ